MTKKDDGGAAFPSMGELFVNDPHGGVSPQSAYGMQGAEGMSLRDWFAGQALIGLVSNWKPEGIDQINGAALAAYVMADAMIRERSRS